LGTEGVYTLYARVLPRPALLAAIQEEARAIVAAVVGWPQARTQPA
jgi:hypothetical protein